MARINLFNFSAVAGLAMLFTLVAVLFAAGSSLYADDMACSCTAAACGNNAIGGDQGDIFTGVTSREAATYFTTNDNTGWSCVVRVLSASVYDSR